MPRIRFLADFREEFFNTSCVSVDTMLLEGRRLIVDYHDRTHDGTVELI